MICAARVVVHRTAWDYFNSIPVAPRMGIDRIHPLAGGVRTSAEEGSTWQLSGLHTALSGDLPVVRTWWQRER
ncbi:hypothetical protein CH249_11600 [Rhodococcus sp. 05-2255-3B1]|nr:hypothetical protein CH250_25160 [Rhodococcus sp. 05-2255-3C]OZE11398.1 hypothetical protein CH249_11600 [Rhodococcus sp. 05-2255-3B1]OZE13124.1 hypothetical protein CH255_25020 [Rhodococcus sp. 05-2255-2A2]